ncbi:MAG: RluA family pseudouridine synthase [Fuerstiella sp.]
MSDPPPEVLYEDNHLLAVCKPAGTLTMGDRTGDVSMVDIATEYLRVKYNKPGNVFVGVVHRLDRPVSGVLLFARTSKAASRLSDQFRQGTVRKIYQAVVEGRIEAAQGTFVDWLLKNRTSNQVSVVPPGTPKAQHCELGYQVLSRLHGRLRLQIEPVTGRSHQIRVQLSSRGLPIVGDVKYGSPHRIGGRILLHAVSLEFDHPTTKQRLSVSAPFDDR